MIDHWNEQPQKEFEKIIKEGVCHTMTFLFTFKKYLKAKEELQILKHTFHHAKNIIFKKIL
jgi:hypothetical protein